MKKSALKKIFKYSLIVGTIAIFLIIIYFSFIYITAPIEFHMDKITDKTLAVQLYDFEKKPLKQTFLNGEYITLKQIPNDTKQCFLSIEDKNFYQHNGLNYKRMAGAMLKNLSKFKFVEGASTISQQLIKNTHLTNEKTLKRKINEIKLTKQMEKALTKDQILESYLNIIYFGDNCYGIQNASLHYFSKPASKLNLDESAILAGMIKSPNKYHPIKQYSSCIKRRNLVLSEMYKDGKITCEEYEKSIKTNTIININDEHNDNKSYQKATIKEAESILKMPEKQIAIGGYRIFTYCNEYKQQALEKSIDKSISEDCCMISINSQNGAIEAYIEKSNLPLINVKRQPASAIKPILVYAPAINENIITLSTQILDQKISINGYEPKNIGDKEYGYVDAKFALSHSLNIPAVKILSYVGIQKAKRYLTTQNIDFADNDDSLALALGGMTYGMSLKDITNCYQTLANKGQYVQAKFINYIVDNQGKVVYRNNQTPKTIYREDTTFLITDILKDCVKSGTAKRLKDLNFEIASKTGTSSISKQNIDAYNISYTTSDVVGCWIGNLDNSPMNIVGGGKPTAFVKNYLSSIYENTTPKNFDMPSGVVKIDIDLNALQNEHIVYKANNFLPERYRQKAYFSRFNQPKINFDNNLTIDAPNITGKIINGVTKIYFDTNIYYEYEIYSIENNNEKLIANINNSNGEYCFETRQTPNTICKYYIKIKAKDYATNNVIKSDSSNIIELYYTQ